MRRILLLISLMVVALAGLREGATVSGGPRALLLPGNGFVAARDKAPSPTWRPRCRHTQQALPSLSVRLRRVRFLPAGPGPGREPVPWPGFLERCRAVAAGF